ncbi:hypothetical protein [Mangrovibacillus cuniculi]|uniref:Intracellular proteinase inhibitor BsuPI domain-containing protein n=1 Tax=Mangrovibacillus cuniculi TaxID=2593652 RepID=A0A7S8CD25_9BACI|nr:hypothetical protein [Mangrovibacillus cuniculi]QPC47606.1 hypothetical protein G8O30_11905 [Mangrovibacillus cuniculi]
MKKLLLCSMLLFATGCSSEEVSTYQEDLTLSNYIEDDSFRFTFTGKKSSYVVGEEFDFIGELLYQGDKKNIEIQYAWSPFYYTLTNEETKVTYLFGTLEPGNYRVLQVDKPFKQQIERHMSWYVEKDRNYTEGVERIPPGQYTVDGYAGFDLVSSDSKTPILLNTTLRIVVNEKEK